MKKILTVGVFDILHIGHILLFKHAREYGDYLIVAVQDSAVVRETKPNAKLIYSTEERMFMVDAIKYVDEVVLYQHVDEIVKNIDYDIFVKGPDQCHIGFQKAVEWSINHGKRVVIIQRTEGSSSSALRDYLMNND
jgi:cytidyltransferase-like protein